MISKVILVEKIFLSFVGGHGLSFHLSVILCESSTFSKQSTSLLKIKYWSDRGKFRIEKILWLRQKQCDVL